MFIVLHQPFALPVKDSRRCVTPRFLFWFVWSSAGIPKWANMHPTSAPVPASWSGTVEALGRFNNLSLQQQNSFPNSFVEKALVHPLLHAAP